jgi:transposase-like protein
VLRIARALRHNEMGADDDWAALTPLARSGLSLSSGIDSDSFIREIYEFEADLVFDFATKGHMHPDVQKLVRDRLGAARQALSIEIYLWIRLTRQTMAIVPEKRSWQLQVYYNGCMLAAIALQLALTVSDAEKLFMCSECHLPYVRHRQAPRGAGRNNFCDRCAKGQAALRQAQRRYRIRKVEARRLYGAGIPIEDIAESLGTDAETVEGWIMTGVSNVKTRKR